MCTSCAIGAFYAVCMFLPGKSFFGLAISKIILSLVMVYVAFDKINIKKYLKQLGFFYAVSLVSAGCVTALSYSNSSFVYSNGGIVYIDTSMTSIVFASVISYILIRLTYGIYRKYATREFLKMIVYKDGKAVCITVLVDTGNLLTDPVGGGPVIVAEQNALKGIVGDSDIYKKFENIKGVRLIPIKTVDNENGLLVGFKPDKICCKNPIREDAIIAVTPNKLGGDYNALAGPHSFR